MKARLQPILSRIGNIRNRVAIAVNPWRTRWQSLDTRVQRMVLVGAALLALAMLWAYVWLPAARGRTQLGERIPVMSAQLATMRVQAEEIRRLNSLPPVVTARSALPLADVSALQALFGANANVTLDENRAFRIVIPAIAYTAWLDQLDSALNRYRVRVAAINLKSLSAGATKGAATAPTKSAEVAVELTLIDDSDHRP